ncbi:MAG: site-specific integrase, partial [Planctomycetota bacterium]
LVGKQRAVEFQNLMRCCYLSGMRLGEALQFHSFRQDCHHVIGGPSPRIRYVSKQKNRKDQVVVMLPEFEQFVATLHPHDDGFYFAPVTRRNVAYTTHKAVGRVIAEIGERAKIVVKHDGHGQPKKYASAHDFRRSCAYRLVSRGYKIFTVQHLMRHADPKTTQQFYSGDMADMVAGEIWGDENELAVEKEVSLRVV